MDPSQLESLLRDGFGNYVIQTAVSQITIICVIIESKIPCKLLLICFLNQIDAATPEKKTELAIAIRPFVPSIRQTPHGRRIATKVNDIIGRMSGNSSGHATPHEEGAVGHVPLPNQWPSRGLYVS